MTQGPWSGDREPRDPRRGKRWLLFIVLALGLAVIVLFLVRRFPDAVATREGQVDLLYYVLLATMVGSGLLLGRRIGLKIALKGALLWVGLGLALVLGYSFRHDLGLVKDRIVGELLPHQALESEGRAIAVRAASDGHFRMEASVNGVPVRFLVDTGASDIVLSPTDARRVGFDLARLAFTRPYQTANGVVRGAPVTLDELTVGSVRLSDVRASVNEAPMDQSLLGMSFLARFKGYEVRGGVLTLYW